MGTESRQATSTPSAHFSVGQQDDSLSRERLGHLTSTSVIKAGQPKGEDRPENLMVRVKLSYKGRSIEEDFLVDTGACGVFLHLDLARQLYGNGFPNKSTEASTCIVANQYVEETHTGPRTSLSVQSRSINCRPFVMRQLSFKGILGYRTLGALGFLIDPMSHRLLTLSDLPVQSSVDDPVTSLNLVETDDLGDLIATKAMSIKPGEGCLVPALLTKDSRANEFCLITQNLRGNLPPGSQVVSSLATMTNSHTDVFILNTTEKSIDIKQGMPVAFSSRVDHRPVCVASAISSSPSQTEGSLSALRLNKEKFLSQFSLSEDLTSKQRKIVQELLWNERKVFSESDYDIGLFKNVKHTIDTGTERPYKETLRRHSPKTREDIKKLVDEMLSNGIIQPSFSPWSSAPVLVQKKSGGKRFAIDYRGVNEKTVKDSYPLPHIADALDCFSGSHYFTCLDLTAGYWQIELDDESKKKTAFTVPQGLYEFVRMPFGLTNAPATFQRAITCCLQGLNWQIALCFLDDIVVFAKDFESHLERLSIVLKRLHEHNLKLKPKKCDFFKTEVTYLGHVVSSQGISTDPSKIEAIQNWEVPKTVTQLRSFLGMAQYYRRFVKDFSLLASPLHDQVKKDAKSISWGEEQQEAFQIIKSRLASAPIMAHPDFNKDFIVDTDASGVGIGCVLSQIQDGKERVIAYNSHKFNKAERKWCTTDREFCALHTAVRLFRSYIHGRRFILRTDHQALIGLLNKPKDLAGKQARWWAYLSNFDYTIKYRQGEKHANADGLSRQPQFEVEEDDESPARLNSLSDTPAEPVDIRELQQGDPMCLLISAYVSGKQTVVQPKDMGDLDDALWRHYLGHKHLYRVKHGILHMDELVVVPRTALSSLLFVLHDSPLAGHLGRGRTWRVVKERFWWPNSFTDVRDYVRSCTTCQARKGNVNKKWAPLNPSQTMDYPFQRVAMDIFQLPKCHGYEYVLVVVDYFSKWAEAFPLRNKCAKTVASVLFNEIFMRYATPEFLHSDRGAEFVAEVLHDLTRLASVFQTHTPAYSPRSDGQAERQIKTIKDMLSKFYAEHGSWFPYLQPAMCAIRSTGHETISFSPYEVMFGRQPRLMVDLQYGVPPRPEQKHPSSWADMQLRLRRIYRDVKERQTLASQRMKDRHDASKKVSAHIFKPGQWVWVQVRPGPRPKILPKWDGPFLVKDVNEVGSIYIRRWGKVVKTPQDHCKLYCMRPSHLQSVDYREAFAKATVDYHFDPPLMKLVTPRPAGRPSYAAMPPPPVPVATPVPVPSQFYYSTRKAGGIPQRGGVVGDRRPSVVPQHQPATRRSHDGSARSGTPSFNAGQSARLEPGSVPSVGDQINPQQAQIREPPVTATDVEQNVNRNIELVNETVHSVDNVVENDIADMIVLDDIASSDNSARNLEQLETVQPSNEIVSHVYGNENLVLDNRDSSVLEDRTQSFVNSPVVRNLQDSQGGDDIVDDIVDDVVGLQGDEVDRNPEDGDQPETGDRSSPRGVLPEPRRMPTRTRAAPQRLGYDRSFRQVTAIGRDGRFWMVSPTSPQDLGISVRKRNGRFRVREVVPGGLAAVKGLCKPGDTLVSVNHRPVESFHQIWSAIHVCPRDPIIVFSR